MPFLRINRDKRGYEYFALVHTSSGRRGKVRQRVLYWYRSPPNVRVGRSPIDGDVMRALEAQYPDVKFDWDALRSTPIPPPTIDWRERRLAQRAARQFRDADESPAAPAAEEPPVLAESAPVEVALVSAVEPAIDAPAPVVDLVPVVPTIFVTAATAVPPASPSRRRRRRRGRRGRPTASPDAIVPQMAQTAGAVSASTEGDLGSDLGSDLDDAPDEGGGAPDESEQES